MTYNNFVEKLQCEENSSDQPHIVDGAHYSKVSPHKPPNPRLIHYSPELAEFLGFDNGYCESRGFLEIFSGLAVPAGRVAYASCYGGHQFGSWAGQLGDGRAINLGEFRARDGSLMTAQLKGAGPTPYSRSADGYAVLRSSVREYLCSEAMHALGVPTTRALSLCLTGQKVIRDILYQGDPRPEPGAVVCRVSRSFLRFGHFELFAKNGDQIRLRQLIEYAVDEHFPDLGDELRAKPGRAITGLFERICASTAKLVVEWLRVGFVHGVLNTDNMSILGETIDYGPYGWLDQYDPSWTPNTTDSGRRYCFAMQPRIAQWNLWQLANALSAVVEDTSGLEASLNKFPDHFSDLRLAMMRAKLGLSGQFEGDAELCGDFEEFMLKSNADMTLFFQKLALIEPACADAWSVVSPNLYRPITGEGELPGLLSSLLGRYFERLGRDAGQADPAARQNLMAQANPVCVPRNYLSQIAIDAAEQDDFGPLKSLSEALSKPYSKETPEQYRQMRPDWALNRPGCSQLSCSS